MKSEGLAELDPLFAGPEKAGLAPCRTVQQEPTALRRDSPTSHHSHERAVLDGMSLGELAPPLPHLRSVASVAQTDTSSATTQDHTQGFGLAHAKIYPINNPLELVKGLDSELVQGI